MSADLHIHVFEEGELEDADFRALFGNVMGSRWSAFAINPHTASSHELQAEEARSEKVGLTDNVWVGEVSWLKAGILGDSETYVPTPIQKIAELIGESLPVVDDELIAKVREALKAENATSYTLNDPETVLSFLDARRGQRAFTVSW